MSFETPRLVPERIKRPKNPSENTPEPKGDDVRLNTPDVTVSVPKRIYEQQPTQEKREYDPLVDEDPDFVPADDRKTFAERRRFDKAGASDWEYRKKLAEARAELMRAAASGEPSKAVLASEELAPFVPLEQRETIIEIPPYWSFFDKDYGKKAYEYIVDHADMDPQQKAEVQRKLDAGKWVDLSADIQSHIVEAHPTVRSLQAELDTLPTREEREKLLRERRDRNKQAYADLVATVAFYQPDIQLPTYEEATAEPEKTIETVAKDFGVEVDFEHEAQSPLIVELWDRYQHLVHDGRVMEEVAKAV